MVSIDITYVHLLLGLVVCLNLVPFLAYWFASCFM